ncbi:uncharacterized protein LOC120713014 isoform X2 [Panicum virgatum]|uniref:uncharacterized protein LOC120713014 isoform X2 n=1 Tax=Panicum virgatum TaxID=38727 RepID=UPI0019D65250|nr:uncharacterized protein LOC120713014 isoform X2 [Panicum virgatum]
MRNGCANVARGPNQKQFRSRNGPPRCDRYPNPARLVFGPVDTFSARFRIPKPLRGLAGRRHRRIAGGTVVDLSAHPLARFALLFQLPLSAGLLFPGIGGDGRHRHVRCVGAFAVRFRGGGAGEAGGTPWPCACAGLALAGWRRQNALASDGCGMRRPAAAPQRHYSISDAILWTGLLNQLTTCML